MSLTALALTLQNVAWKFFMLMDNTGGTWTLQNFTSSGKDLAANVGAAVCMILGAVMIVVALVKAATGLLSHGKKQTEWVPIVVLFIAGVIFVGAAGVIKATVAGQDGLGKQLGNTIQNMGTSPTVGTEFQVE